MKKITLFIALIAFTFGFSQTFPIDFSTAEDTFVGDGGCAFALVANPDDAADQVGQITANGGQYENVQLDLDTYLDLTTANTTITFDFYSTTTVPGLVKLESTLNGNNPVEMSFSPSGLGWETITLDFSTATHSWPNTADPLVLDQYAKFVIFPDFGVTSTGTYYVDDIAGAANGATTTPPLTTFNLDFETATNVAGYEGLVYTDLTDNDVTTGINTSAKVGKLESVNAAPWCHIQVPISPSTFDLSAGDKGFSIMYKGNRSVTVKFKLEGSGSTEVDATYSSVGEWEKLLFNFSSSTSTGFNKIVLFTDPGSNTPSTDPADDVFMIDNLVFDTWTNLGGEVVASAPTTNAPTPTVDASDVISIYSDAYTDIAGTNFNPGWGQSTVVNTAYDPTGEGTNTVIEYSNFNYQGTEFTSTDMSAMTHAHFDVWTASEATVQFTPISPGQETLVSSTSTGGVWTSIDIPLSSFPNVNFADVFQLKYVGSGTVYLDNIYFYTAPAATAPTTNAPTPTVDASDVISIYSDAYTDIAGTNFNPGWGQSTVVNTAYDPTGEGTNTVIEYSNFNYQGTEFTSTDMSAMTHAHFDVWTASEATVQFTPISPGQETLVSSTSTGGVWTSIDIPLSSFPNVNFADVFQLKYVGSGTVYLDNIYFYTEPAATAPTTNAPTPPARDASDVISIYSDAYALGVVGPDYAPNWGQSGTVDAAYDPTGEGNNTVLAYTNFNYQGTVFGAPFPDASAMEYLHVDVWTATAGAVLKVSPINNGTGDAEFLVEVPLVNAGWSSVDLPKSSFTGMTWDSVFQFKFDGQAGTTPSDVYIDNIYFWKEASNATAPTTNAPTPPARDASDVISIYSDAYALGVVGPDYAPNWGQSGTVDAAYDPTGEGNNTVLAYTNFNYQGTVFGAPFPDASAMEYLHVDVWTATAGAVLKVSPINNGTGDAEFLVEVPLVNAGWSSVDLPKSSFTGMTWDSVFQFKFDGQAGTTPSDVYIDNIYFWKEASAGIDENVFNTVKMFPNPAKDTVQFSVNSNENLDIEIFDMLGKSVLRVNDVQNEVNISDLNSGLYFVQMTLGTQRATKKLIVN